MREARRAWVLTVPSVVAWSVAYADRRVIPCENDRLRAGDLVLLRADNKAMSAGYEVLEAYLGRSIAYRPAGVIVATATLERSIVPTPEDQGRWSSKSSWLLTGVRILDQPMLYRRGGHLAPASARLLGNVRMRET